MKTLISFIVLLSLAFVAHAQPCKTVKPGMNSIEVIEAAGEPFSIDTTGENYGYGAVIFDKDKPVPALSRGGNYIIVWSYGDQEVLFYGEKVNQVDINVLKHNEASRMFFEGEINIFEFDDMRNEIKKLECE